MTQPASRRAACTLALAAPALASAAPGRVAVPAALPFRRDPDPADAYGAPLAAGLLLVLLAAAALHWRLRKMRAAPPAAGPARQWLAWLGPGAAAGNAIEVVASKVVGPGLRLHVVQWGGQQYLLSNNQATVTLLDRREAEPAHRGPAKGAYEDAGQSDPVGPR